MRARVLTFNTLFRGDVRPRMSVLADLLEGSDYDIVCLQEVISPLVLARLRRRAASYPHAAFTWTFPLVRGGLVTLSRRPITRVHYETYPFTRPARPEWFLRKGALFTRVRLPGGHLTVVNTHLSANMDMDWSPANPYTRAEQTELRRLAAAIGRIPGPEHMAVMGDFNVPRDSPYLHGFASATGLKDALTGDATPTFRPEYADIGAIDQLLTTPSLHADARVTFKEEVLLPTGRRSPLSDHYAIEATLSSPEPAW